MAWLFKARTVAIIAAALVGLVALSLLGRVVDLRACEGERAYGATLAFANFETDRDDAEALAVLSAFQSDHSDVSLHWDEESPLAFVETGPIRSQCRETALALEKRFTDAGFTVDALACRCADRRERS